MTRKHYEMSDEQLDTLLNACQPVPYLVVGGMEPRSPHEKANTAWAALGRELGFKHMTVRPDGPNQACFTAEPLEEEKP